MATTEQLPPAPGLPGDEQQEREFARKLAERYRFAFIDLREQRIDAELFRTIPADLMFRYNFVPLEVQNNVLAIAAADPGQVQMSDELPLLLGKKLLIRVATARQIGDILKRTEQSQRVLEQATEAFTLQTSKEEDESEETISGDRLTRDSTASPVVRLVETIIFTALERRASDVHIEARDTEVAVKYRIDGVLQHAMQPIAKEWHSTVLSRIKVLSDLDIAERRVPQDGRFRVKYKGRYIDLRVSIMPASHGEDAVLRVLDKETLSEKFSSLTLDVVGFSDEETRRFRRYIREPYGMVLVTGPTGSGKTTTLYAAINEIKSDEDKIVTIEDPVEYQLRGITQIPVNEKKGLTFARGLRSILRHDPDKIMVGEIRDQETAQIAIQSALTGHLVFTTVHANNVTDVIGRFINMGVEPYNFVSALNCIMAQRLVRVICKSCKKPKRYSHQELQEAGLDPAVWGDVTFAEGAGCLECSGTGYHGRTAICELLDLTDRIREMIVDRRPTSEIKRVACEEGMTALRESGLAKIRAGITTLKEINKVTFVE
ncbi:MAG: pilus assembly protein PilB [Acidobacteria bacterium 13_2_20CM_57_17]|nr:MAG: pilus assembly protein PilB [Acidobacteria bacterium 13_2_20CM_57_17]OLB94940.1 MAG: pilus assembly protein PilB [Acidobacteria bacterium 13_2_20CM_2_57_12]